MVQKVLCIVLVLLWTMPLFMAKHSMKTKYIIKQQVNYREEGEIINKPLSCTELVCNEYQTNKDGMIGLSRSKRDTSIQYRRCSIALHVNCKIAVFVNFQVFTMTKMDTKVKNQVLTNILHCSVDRKMVLQAQELAPSGIMLIILSLKCKYLQAK